MIPRCPDCGRPVVRELVRAPQSVPFSNVTNVPTPWWWCSPCGKRVEPNWTRLGDGSSRHAWKGAKR